MQRCPMSKLSGQQIADAGLDGWAYLLGGLQTRIHTKNFATGLSVVNAIGASPFWNSTAIFLQWDDWGGWYDHVDPPKMDAMGPGFRVPLLVVSPYARHGYVSHHFHEASGFVRSTA